MDSCCFGRDDAEREAFFNEHVEPLLRRRCYGCHSHAANVMQGGLALDWRSGWLQGGQSGAAIVPGKPEDSLLVEAIRRQGLEMPPDESLSVEEVDVLARWVADGAFDPRVAAPETEAPDDEWWSLRPLAPPAIPATTAFPNQPPASAVDAFVDAELLRRGLAPAPPADRRLLIRRLYFDLLGLPPTPADVQVFVDDEHPLAYERLIDRLLASPRYGERWARHWLDVVHFADSHGFEHDVFRPHAWPYRDYVIESLNQDLEWSEFVRQQLAADFFYPELPQRTVALGFLGAGPTDLSTANTAPITFAYMERDILLTQTMAALVSSTANCARCHDHKFDPISQRDYYALQAVFAGVGRGDVFYDEDAAIARRRQQWRQWIAAAEQADASLLLAPQTEPLVEAWEQQVVERPIAWHVLFIDELLSSSGSQLERLDDGSIRAGGSLPDTDVYTLVGAVETPRVTAIRLEVLTDDALPHRGPGRAANGNLHLSEVAAQLLEPGVDQPRELTFRRAMANFNQSDWTIDHAVDGNAQTAWGIHPKQSQAHEAVFELREPLDVVPGSRLSVSLKQLHGRGHLIGRLRLSVALEEREHGWIIPDDVRASLRTPRSRRDLSQRLAIAAHAVASMARPRLAELPEPSQVYAAATSFVREGKTLRVDRPEPVHLLHRGDIHSPGDEAAAGAISILSGLSGHFAALSARDEGERRAALADWVVDPRNPLAWRSIANRVWHYHFERGLCDTPNDLGRMGSEPTHPELLDWLACRLRHNGSLKELHRLIVTSNAYRRSGQASHDNAARDQGNRYLWRMTPRRLDADSYRDAVMQASGELRHVGGGPSVQNFSTSPGQQLTPKVDYASFDWSTPAAARRSIYRAVWRGLPDPFMDALDFPDLGMLSPKRTESVSAVQALTLWNNSFVLHHGERLAWDAQRRFPGRPDLQAREVYQRLLQRDPSPGELRTCVEHLQQHGLAALARVLLNANEFLYVD